MRRIAKCIHTNAVLTSMDLHAAYGGVVPEIAAREHVRSVNPVIEQALQDAFLNPVVTRIDLVFSDSEEYLQQQAEQGNTVDVVYLDPMFPQRDQNQQAVKKQAQVKKQMQLLHMLLPEDGEMDLGDNLLGLAQKVAKRVVVKRPRLAVFLANQETTHQWLGDACRFDAYFQHERLD